jgi:virginiamycin B lyase
VSGFGPANQITVGPDGRLWFTAADDNQVAAITTGGSISRYPLPTPAVAVRSAKVPMVGCG